MFRQYRTIIIIAVIVIIAIWLNLPSNLSLFGRPNVFTHLGLDLVGGVQALLEADVPAGTTVDPTSMNTAVKIVENRVNGLGVSEAVVQKAGSQRIVVEIPGVKDPQQAIATIKTTGLLEFVDMSSITAQEAFTMMNQKIVTDFGSTSGPQQPSPVVTPTLGSTPTTPPGGTPTLGSSPTTSPTLTATTAAISPTTKTTPGSITSTTTTQIPTLQIWHTVMTGSAIQNVNVVPDQTGGYEVAFTLTSDGGKTFSDFTSAHVGDVLAIILDKEVISTPTIQNPITDGKGVITGKFTSASANQLAIQLRYGSLPIPLKVVEVSIVGPTLGQDSLRKSLIAGGVGLGIVIFFMAFYYRLPGLVADLALICYALIAFSIFRSYPITLTLPGIAGFVLSIGMAVDANILIFERLKEELRTGRSLRPAIDLGWGRAWPSIRDSNFSTLITCGVLYFFGSAFGASIVKGFSLTLAIGVLVSLFTAVIVTRTFLHLVLDNLRFTEHPKWFGV